DGPGGKTGLDDFLFVPGNDIENSWPKLTRLPLDDRRFANLTAWWQKRQERLTALDAIRQHDGDALELSETAGLYSVHSAKYAVTLTFDRVTNQRNSVYAELTVRLGATDLLDAVDVNLKSDTAHDKHAKSLTPYCHTVPWKLLLQKAAARVLKR